MIPGFGGAGTPPSAQDPATWHGAALILGIDDAAMLSLPDLPDLLAGPPLPLAAPAPPKVVGSTTFVPCAGAATNTDAAVRPGAAQFAAPRLDRAGYRMWGQCMRTLLDLLSASGGSAHRRDVMLCASMPLTSREAGTIPADAEAWPLAILDEVGPSPTNQRLTDAAIIGSARLQLAWPWLLTAAAASAPEGLEAPEGRLMGMIARSAVERGAFRSAAGRLVPGVTGIVPMLTEAAMRRGLPNGRADWLGDRLCVVGQKTDQFVLLSDSTMAASRSWRAGGVSRLMGLILRAARVMGQDRVFEPSGPALWNGVRQDLEGLMERLRTAGALAGDTPADAYTVHCDASTMTQSDIDLGPDHRHRRLHRRAADRANYRNALDGNGGCADFEGSRVMPISVPDGGDGFQPLPGFAFHVSFAAHSGNPASSDPFTGMGKVAPEVAGGISGGFRPRGDDGAEGHQGRRPQLRSGAAAGHGDLRDRHPQARHHRVATSSLGLVGVLRRRRWCEERRLGSDRTL